MYIFTGRTSRLPASAPLLLACCLGLCLPCGADAAHPAMAVSQGMGNTVRANPWDPMTAYAAPGMVWIDGRFEIGGSGQYGNNETNSWNVGAYDAQTSKIGFGLFWSRQAKLICRSGSRYSPALFSLKSRDVSARRRYILADCASSSTQLTK